MKVEYSEEFVQTIQKTERIALDRVFDPTVDKPKSKQKKIS
jgi:hypothetical protein